MHRSSYRALATLLCGLAACSGTSGQESNPASAAGSGGANAGAAAGGGAGKRATNRPPVTGPDGPESLSCPVVVKDEDCDKTQLPIVFVHGTYGSGDNIGNVALLFGSNGYCQDRFVAVEYNSLGSTPAGLDALIDKVRMQTGKDQVELMGHSQGTAHCVQYLNDAAHAAKVAHYVNLSGRGNVPNGVKTLSLSSKNDIGSTPIHAPNAEKTVTFEEADHFAVAASTEAFVAIWTYLRGTAPEHTTVQCGDAKVTIEGIAETFADNAPFTSGAFEVYAVGPTARENAAPVLTLNATPDGHLGPIQLDRGVAYEFKGVDGQGKTIGRMYFAPFKRSNRLMRFLSPSQNPLVVATTSGNVKTGPGHVAMVARYLGGAFRQDLKNSLQIDGSEILTPQNAPRTNPTVGLFMADQNLNGGNDLGASFSAPFIVGTDVYMDASSAAFMEVVWFDGTATTTLKIPNWPSSDGMLSVTLP